MRKRLTGFLAVFACLLMLTACGGTAQPDEAQEIPEETKNALYSNTEMTIQQMDSIITNGLIEEQKDFAVIYAGLQSWESAKKEIGTVDFSTDADGNGSADCFTDKSITVDEDGNYITTVTVAGDQKTADCVISYKKDLSAFVNIVANVNYSFKELLEQAGMNTFLGMGTTFALLIILSLIIAVFGRAFVNMEKKKREEADRKEREAAAEKEAALASAQKKQGSLASESSASQSDDDTLVAVLSAAATAAADDNALIAVITAAVAAYRAEEAAAGPGGFVPAADPDEFVVRKIRRIGRK